MKSEQYQYKVYAFVKDCGDGSTAIEWVGEDQLDIFTFYCEDEDDYNDGDGFIQKDVLYFVDRNDAKEHDITFWDEEAAREWYGERE